MRGVRISYLIEHPEYIPQLAKWLFEGWDAILGEKTPIAIGFIASVRTLSFPAQTEEH